VGIVSGLALGVDGIAHQTALDCGGITIAVLGCGVDIIAPASHALLYHAIAKSRRGLIISEMPLSHRPDRGLFPARNRIISGLSCGVVVTEGAQDSGALITARYAAEQGRDVFAVPGPITSSLSRGPAKLLKDGATVVERAEDILDVIGSLPTASPQSTQPYTKPSYTPGSVLEASIIDTLKKESMDGDALLSEVSGAAQDVLVALSTLELSGIVKQDSDGTYHLTHEGSLCNA
jgi:DNA processing protein